MTHWILLNGSFDMSTLGVGVSASILFTFKNPIHKANGVDHDQMSHEGNNAANDSFMTLQSCLGLIITAKFWRKSFNK